MSNPKFVVLLLAVASCAVFLHLGRMAVVGDNEGQRATPPLEMLRNHNFVIPTINDFPYLVKPPLLYWAIAAVYSITGVITPFTARIPTALSGIALSLSVYLALRRDLGERQARWAALIIAITPYDLDRMRWAELDMPLTVAVFLSIIALWRASGTTSNRRLGGRVLAGGLAFGAALMLKGPPTFLFFWAGGIACLIARSESPNQSVRTGIKWSLGAFALEVILKTAADLIPFAGKILGTPVALGIVLVTWSYLAWRSAPEIRGRTLVAWLSIMSIGIALAAPWAAAVLHREGWANISTMLNDQVVERTYSASRINSGTPFYYLLALPVMLAPWGLLLPLHASRYRWLSSPPAYRFCVIAGWVSVLVFSLIAGKEYEYILPGVTFLVAATAVHLPGLHLRALTIGETWGRGCLRAMTFAAPVLAVGGAIYLCRLFPEPSLYATVWPLVAIATAAAIFLRRNPDCPVQAAYPAAFALVLMYFMHQSYFFTGARSPESLAKTAGNLRRAGYDIAASKIYPGFSFYARVPIPVDLDANEIRARLSSDKPFFFIVRKHDWERTVLAADPIPQARIVAGPTEYKGDMVIVANVPLPAQIEKPKP